MASRKKCPVSKILSELHGVIGLSLASVAEDQLVPDVKNLVDKLASICGGDAPKRNDVVVVALFHYLHAMTRDFVEFRAAARSERMPTRVVQ